MRRRRSRWFALRCSAALFSLIVALGPWSHVLASHEPGHMGEIDMRVEVSYKGFNGQPDFTVEAQQGQKVTITFVWADTSVPDNAHRMRIEGYDLRTKLLDAETREDTISFIADKPGKFQIKCDWRCEGHKEALESAWLTVGAGGPGVSSAALVSTSLSMAPSTFEVSGGPVDLTASLGGADGEAIEGAQVRFYLDTNFAGAEGEMEIGAAETDASGRAAITYKPTSTGEQDVTARFDGMGVYSESEQKVTLNVLDASPAYTVEPIGLDALRDWAPVLLALVVLGVWSTFGFVLYQVFRVAKAGDRDET